MVELVRAGLVTAHAERVVAGGKKIEVASLRITEAGRRALSSGVPAHARARDRTRSWLGNYHGRQRRTTGQISE